MAKTSPLIAGALSLVPGVGHWVLGKKGKAVALFVIDAGVLFSVFFFRTFLGYLFTFLGYLMTAIPAILETYTLARGKKNHFGESRPYILAMLLVEGFAALPLLWQSPAFSKRIKIMCSIAVPVLAVLYFGFLGFFGVRFLHDGKL